MTYTTTFTTTGDGSIGREETPRLPPDHPALAYVDDASSLVDLIRDEPDLLSRDENYRFRDLTFLREFIRDFAAVGAASPSCSMDDHGEEVAVTATENGGDSSDGVITKEEASMDGDRGCDGEGDDDGDDDHGRGRAMEEDEEEVDGDEGGYWDDEGECTVRDGYVWPPRPPPSSPGPGDDADADGDCDPPKEEVDDDDHHHDDDDVEAYECVVIGAGAAGVGVSVALIAGGMKRNNMLVIESRTVGSSFDSWPPHTRFISPSVYSNPFGQVDLNAVDPWSSPAVEALSMIGAVGDGGHRHERTGTGARRGGSRGECVDGDSRAHGGGGRAEEGEDVNGSDDEKEGLEFGDTQHLSGRQYAEYLRRVASRWSIPVRENCTVTGVRRVPSRGTDSMWKFDCFDIDVVENDTRRVDGTRDRDGRRRRRRQEGDRNVEATAAGMTTGRSGRTSKTIYSRFVVWCGGEWCHPNIPAGLSSTTMGRPKPKMAPPTKTSRRAPPRKAAPSSSPSSIDRNKRQNNDSAEGGERSEEAEAGYVHYSRVGATEGEWRDLVRRANGVVESDGGDDGFGDGCRGDGHVVVAGAFEAGVDATCTLVELGAERVTVVEESCDVPPCWEGAIFPDSADIVDGARAAGDGPAAGGTTTSQEGATEMMKKKGRAGRVVSSDPSVSLSASSARRIRSAISTGRVTLLPGRALVGVDVEVEAEEAVRCHHHDDGDRSGADGRGGRVDRGCGEGTRRRFSFVTRVARTSSSAEGSVKEEEEVLPPSSAPVVLCTGFEPGRSFPVLASLVDWDSPLPPSPRSSEDDTVGKVATTSEVHQRHRKHRSGRRKHHGGPLVSEGCDESLRVPGVFICGPMLRHTATASRRRGGVRESNNVLGGNGAALHCPQWRRSASRRRGHRRGGTAPVKSNTSEDGQQLSIDLDSSEDEVEQTIIFCFIYKFRTRFALVAGEILSRLVLEDHSVQGGKGEDDGGHSSFRIDSVGHERLSRVEEMLRSYQEKGMLLKDLSCATCEDVVC